jgi:hypothetical protein
MAGIMIATHASMLGLAAGASIAATIKIIEKLKPNKFTLYKILLKTHGINNNIEVNEKYAKIKHNPKYNYNTYCTSRICKFQVAHPNPAHKLNWKRQMILYSLGYPYPLKKRKELIKMVAERKNKLKVPSRKSSKRRKTKRRKRRTFK